MAACPSSMNGKIVKANGNLGRWDIACWMIISNDPPCPLDGRRLPGLVVQFERCCWTIRRLYVFAICDIPRKLPTMTVTPADRYTEHEDPRPGRGALPARAWHKSDADRFSLNGKWKFSLSPTATAPSDFSSPAFADGKWDTIAVPSHWVLQDGKYGQPAYTNVQYPFPIDPPRVPTENPTGDYRLAFDLPATWPQRGSVSGIHLAES